MQTFGNGVEEGLTSVETAVKAYNTSQVQDTVDAFEKQFCKDAKYVAPVKTPLNFTGMPPNSSARAGCNLIMYCIYSHGSSGLLT